ncbi:MAG TPA: HAD family hydrolase [Terracidiphilus sp.]|nr:HAD family hydrolase [Terracidiphilus sp.]
MSSDFSKKPAVFLDRDGTIIRQVELLHKPEQVKLLPGAAKAIRLLNRAEYFVVVATNQPVVARGLSSPEGVCAIHDLICARLKRQHARIDAFYFCPHHPNATIKAYRTTCECRKPRPGMMIKAAVDYNLDISRSVMIGDTTQDVLAGIQAGLSTILVQTGHAGRDPWQYECKPDFTVPDLLGAVHLWLRNGKPGFARL